MEKQKPQVGDVVVSSYGYDATFYDFYKVVKTTKTQVTLQKLGKTKSWATNGGPTVGVKPDVNVTVGEPFRRKVKDYGSWWSVAVGKYEFAQSLWSEETFYGETAPGWY